MGAEMLCHKLMHTGLFLVKERKLCHPLINLALHKNISKYILFASRRYAFINTCFYALNYNNSKLTFKNSFCFNKPESAHESFLNNAIKCFSSDKKPPFTRTFGRQEFLRKVLQDKQQKLHQTEMKIRKSGKLILDDFKTKTKMKEKIEDLYKTELKLRKSGRLILKEIKETKTKMKEKMEEVIQKENIMTVPNLLCVTRIVLSPYLGYLIINQNFQLALVIVVFAGVTDLLDGWIARTFENQSSKLGSFLDPMADKVIIATMFLSLTYAGIIPVPLTSLIIARDVLLVGAGFYIRYQSLPSPRTLSRYFDVTLATAQLAPTTISKVNTMVQLATVAGTLAAPVFNYMEHPALHAMWYITAGTTIASAISYILSKNTYKYLKDSKR